MTDERFDGIQLRVNETDPDDWPTQLPRLSCRLPNQIALEHSDLSLDTQREILFQGNGQIRSIGDIRFLTGATTPTERLSLLANGDIDIGTTTTPANLKVNGTIKAIAFQGDGSTLDGVVHTAGGTMDGSLIIKKELTVQGKTSVLTDSGNPAIQLYATGGASGYLTLLDQNNRQAIQLDAGTGTGSIQLKNSVDKGVCLLQTSDDAGYISLNNKSGERAVVQLYASQQGESGVVKVLDSDGNLSVQLNESGISTRSLVVTDSLGNTTASIFSDGSINTSGSLSVSGGISTSSWLSADTIDARAFGTVNTGLINVNKSNGNPAVQLFETTEKTGFFTVYGSDGNRKAWLNGQDSGYVSGGVLNALKTDGKIAVQLFALNGDKGFISVRGTDGNQKVWINGQDSGYIGAGVFSAMRPNGNIAAQLYGAESGNLAIFNSDGKVVTEVGTNTVKAGFIETKTKDDKVAVRISTVTADGSGSIGVYDSSGNLKLYLQGNGAKNFVMPHPHDENRNIFYAAIEGPEAAAYIRGKAKLTVGRAEIEFPEHFSLVVNPETITIQLTPRSAESKGLAVVAQSECGFSVRELWQGEGEYEFDYFVAGVRQGFEHFTPVVAKGFTAFGEPMTEALPISSVSPQPASMAQEAMASPAAQPMELLNPEVPQLTGASELPSSPTTALEVTEPDLASPVPQLFSINPVPSPSAINFEDK